MQAATAINKLNILLPLAKRQAALPDTYRAIHKAVLFSLFERGQPPNMMELEKLAENTTVETILERLAADDLVVLASNDNTLLGAYPMTIEETPHKLLINATQRVNAMCALDALSVAAMFDTDVEIQSSCHISLTPVQIHQRGRQVVSVTAGEDIYVGIRWQNPKQCAAHSLCLEMIYLRDKVTAVKWQEHDKENKSIFTLEEAIDIGAAFFEPLLT